MYRLRPEMRAKKTRASLNLLVSLLSRCHMSIPTLLKVGEQLQSCRCVVDRAQHKTYFTHVLFYTTAAGQHCGRDNVGITGLRRVSADLQRDASRRGLLGRADERMDR